MNKSFITYWMLIGTSFFWGSSFILTESILKDNPSISPYLLTFSRLIVSVLFFFLIFLFLPGKVEKIRKKDLPYFLGMALFQPFLYYIGENYGLIYSSSSVASVTIASIPVFVPFAVFISYKEPFRMNNVLGAFISLLGIAIMTIHPEEGFKISAKGFFFLFVAVMSIVWYSVILQKVVKNYSPLSITFYQNFIGLFYFLPIVLFLDLKTIALITATPKIILYVLILGVVCSSLAFLLYNQAVKNIGVVKASIFENAIPIFTMLVVSVLGLEILGFRNIGGMMIVILGVLLSQFSLKRPLRLARIIIRSNIREYKRNKQND